MPTATRAARHVRRKPVAMAQALRVPALGTVLARAGTTSGARI
jgi:hypothetical protein